jgi:hypothetical protein
MCICFQVESSPVVTCGSQLSVESQLVHGATPAVDQEAARLLIALSSGRHY